VEKPTQHGCTTSWHGRLPWPQPYKPLNHRVDGWLRALAPKRRSPDHVEQIEGKMSCEKPFLIGCEAPVTRFVPSQALLPLFCPVFNLGPTIVDRDYRLCYKSCVGQNKSLRHPSAQAQCNSTQLARTLNRRPHSLYRSYDPNMLTF
jgi:hypothetical protein